MHPFKNIYIYYNSAGGEQTVCIYLPVSSLEHHGERTVSHQVLPAVLEVSHRLHRDADDDDAHKRCSVASNVPSARPPSVGGHSPTVPKPNPLSPGGAAALLDDFPYVLRRVNLGSPSGTRCTRVPSNSARQTDLNNMNQRRRGGGHNNPELDCITSSCQVSWPSWIAAVDLALHPSTV